MTKRWLSFGNPIGAQYYVPVSFADDRFEFAFSPVSWWRMQVDLNEPRVASGFEGTLRKIGAANVLANHAGTELLVMLMPFKGQVYGPVITDRKIAAECYDASYDALYDKLANSVEALGIRTLDLRSQFREAAAVGEKLYWTTDPHLTPAGHQLTAGIVAERLKAFGLGQNVQPSHE